MGLWSRLKRRVRAVVERLTPGAVPAPPEPEGAEPSYGGIIGDTFGTEESFLPPGWAVVGLYHEGEKTTRIFATDDTEVTDRDISHADAIIVWYRDAGGDGYRWIHGADDWRSLADQIARTTAVVSPV